MWGKYKLFFIRRGTMRKTTVVFLAITVTFVALVVALSATEAGASTSLYLEFSGITGGSQALHYAGWIDINSVQWGVTSTGGGAEGKASLSDVTWTQQMDKSFPSLFTDIADGKRISSAEVDFVAPTGDQMSAYFTMKFTNVFLTSLNLNGTTGDQPTVSGSFDYQQIEMTYYPYKPDGTRDAGITASYDLTRTEGALGEVAYLYGLGLAGPSVAPVPVPAALWLFGPGLAGLAAIRRRFKK